MSPSEEYKTAVHEVGHAVMQFLYRRGVERITIIPNEAKGSLGCCTYTDSYVGIWRRFAGHEGTTRDVELIFRSAVAGAIAEELVCGTEWNLYGSDAERAIAAMGSAGCLAIYEAFPESEAVRGFEALRDEWADRQVEIVRSMLRENILSITAIADKLMERKIIDGRLAREIFKNTRQGESGCNNDYKNERKRRIRGNDHASDNRL